MSDTPKVSHRPKIPFDYGTLREDAATLYVNNKVFEGFKNITVKRNLLNMAGSFEIVITDVWQPMGDFGIKPGDRIHCHIGKEAIFEGWVDTFNVSITSGSRNFSIAGRDRTADLIDCSAEGSNEFNGQDLRQIAEKLCSPFGIKVLNPNGVDLGKKFEKFSIKIGEKVFEALSRAAKAREIILLTSTHGNLVLDKVATKRSGTELVEGVNIRVTGANFDNSQRFSQVTVKGQQPGTLGGTKDASQGKGQAFDRAVTRYRPLTILADQASDTDAAQKRAQYETSIRSSKAFKCNGSVNSWRKKDGTIWKINELVPFKALSLGINDTLLISGITYTQTDAGRSVDLELIEKDAMKFQKEKNKKEEGGSILDTIGHNA